MGELAGRIFRPEIRTPDGRICADAPRFGDLDGGFYEAAEPEGVPMSRPGDLSLVEVQVNALVAQAQDQANRLESLMFCAFGSSNAEAKNTSGRDSASPADHWSARVRSRLDEFETVLGRIGRCLTRFETELGV